MTGKSKTLYWKSMITLGVTILLLSPGMFPQTIAAQETRVRCMSLEQLNKIIETQNAVIVDLRTPGEFRQRRIPHAVNIPVELLRSDRFVLDVYNDRTLLLYCRTINKTKLAL
ncbi:MAG TPA: rhodanese-like domain-containing protein [Deltaproteobacteria bacterium]|nr:rhodanese-like domain-containing protein [Deltaproteobacteria bacterium]